MNSWQDDPNKKTLLIIRRSGYGQKENTSGHTQEREGKRYCEEFGLDVVQEESIIESAFKSNNRKKWRSLLNEALQKDIRHIIFYHSSRENRNLTDNESNEQLSLEGKVIFHHVCDRKVYWKGTSESDWQAKDFSAVINKGESRTKSRR